MALTLQLPALCTAFVIDGSTSAPAAVGALSGIKNLPSGQTHIALLRQPDGTEAYIAPVYRVPPESRAACALRLTTCRPRSQIATDGDGDSQVTWTGLSAGTYLAQARPSLTYATTTVYLHDGYTLDSVLSPLSRYSVAGGQHITLNGTGLYESEHQGSFHRHLARADDRCRRHRRPDHRHDQRAHARVGDALGLALWLRRPGAAYPRCVRARPVGDGLLLARRRRDLLERGVDHLWHMRQLKLAFIYVGPVTDFGWTYSHNKGRLSVESSFGGLVDAMTYFESEPEGEFEGSQDSRGMTIASGTAVNPTKADGSPNMYYSAFTKMKTLCDDDFDLVFSTSFGFMSQTLDVSTDYAPCRVAADGETPHNTHFVHATGYKTNDLMSTMFGKIYQMRYLTGFVAGDALAAAKDSPFATPRNGKCVAYIAAYPIPEVRRGINAFTLGCAAFRRLHRQGRLDGHVALGQGRGAAALPVERRGLRPDRAALGHDQAQLVYKAYGGLGVGYNSDMREVVGDSVLTAPMLEWGPIFRNFVEQVATDSWVADQQAWPAAAEGAVKLMPTFSPKVDPATVQFVEHEHTKLKNAPGVEAFHHVFCGPLKKRWAYEFADPAAAAGRARAAAASTRCGAASTSRSSSTSSTTATRTATAPANRTVPPRRTVCGAWRWRGRRCSSPPSLMETSTKTTSSPTIWSRASSCCGRVRPSGAPSTTTPRTAASSATARAVTDSSRRRLTRLPDAARGLRRRLDAQGRRRAVAQCLRGMPCRHLRAPESHLPAGLVPATTSPTWLDDRRPGRDPANSMVQIFFAVSDELTRLQLGTGAATAAQCLCQEGFFVDADGACAACPDGAICHGAHFPPVAKRGYGQLALSNSSADFFECPNYELCLAGSSGCDCGRLGQHEDWRRLRIHVRRGRRLRGWLAALRNLRRRLRQGALRVQRVHALERRVRRPLDALRAALVPAAARPHLEARQVASTTSFVQYLDIYATFDIAWADGSSLKQLFVALGFSTCARRRAPAVSAVVEGGLAPAGIPAASLPSRVHSVRRADRLGLSRARQGAHGKAVGGMLSPLLFYLNMYYYTGIANSFEMLICSQDGDGSYLVVNPTIKCWQGERLVRRRRRRRRRLLHGATPGVLLLRFLCPPPQAGP